MRKIIALAAAAGVFLADPGLAKKEQEMSHFGTEVHRPKFKGPGDFFKRLNQVMGIFVLGRLSGKPVHRPWVSKKGLSPAFREKIALVVTITNHCVG